jgi:hypothetical protein
MTHSEKTALAIALIAAAISFGQLRVSIRQGKHNATFEHLKKVRELIREASVIDPEIAREQVLAFYQHGTNELPLEGATYLRLLDALDLLGIAYKHRLVDRRIVRESVGSILRNEHAINRDYLNALSTAVNSATVYADLTFLIDSCRRVSLKDQLLSFWRGTNDRQEARSTSSTSASPFTAGETRASGHPGISSPSPSTTTADEEVNSPPIVSSG